MLVVALQLKADLRDQTVSYLQTALGVLPSLVTPQVLRLRLRVGSGDSPGSGRRVVRLELRTRLVACSETVAMDQ